MISVEEALARLFALAPAPEVEEVPLLEAGGRVLLRPLRATRDQPPFAASAMDGYAVRAADVVPGARLGLVGESAAGRGFAGTLGPGETARILTGAPLPEGADAVVIQEEVSCDGDHVVVSPSATPGHVRPRGNDFRLGAEVTAPRRLSPADVALIAAMGHASVPVARRPEVAILSTGDELVAPGEAPGGAQIFAANAFGLHAMLMAEGAQPRIFPPVPDRAEALALAFDLAQGADLVVTVGGASVGDHDLVAPAAKAAGAEIDFHRVAMRPGKPLLAGRFADGRLLLGLPGNPVSALVCGVVFLLPLVRVLLGLPGVPAPRTRVALAAPLPAGGPREHYFRARRLPDGTVEPFARQDSSLLTLLAEADALIVQPPGQPALPVGNPVDVIQIR